MSVKLTSDPNVEMSHEFGWRENGVEVPGHAMQLNGSVPR